MSTQANIDWYICTADSDDVKAGHRPGLKVGDELWRVPRSIGPIRMEHSHWDGWHLDAEGFEQKDWEFVAAAVTLTAEERAVLAELAKQKELSLAQTLRQAIRCYQMVAAGHMKMVETNPLPMMSPACTCDPGHICDGNRGHSVEGCPGSCPQHGQLVR